jgi:hypothetical protein
MIRPSTQAGRITWCPLQTTASVPPNGDLRPYPPMAQSTGCREGQRINGIHVSTDRRSGGAGGVGDVVGSHLPGRLRPAQHAPAPGQQARNARPSFSFPQPADITLARHPGPSSSAGFRTARKLEAALARTARGSVPGPSPTARCREPDPCSLYRSRSAEAPNGTSPLTIGPVWWAAMRSSGSRFPCLPLLMARIEGHWSRSKHR